jgi:D-glycero-alpha-D-manno-heptose-7-phosphate kinase
MNEIRSDLITMGNGFGIKVCGAGGGGCFLIIHPAGKQEEIKTLINKYNMHELPFVVEKPL